jgi:hypothetical protein
VLPTGLSITTTQAQTTISSPSNTIVGVFMVFETKKAMFSVFLGHSPVQFHRSPAQFIWSAIQFHRSPIDFLWSAGQFHWAPAQRHWSPAQFHRLAGRFHRSAVRPPHTPGQSICTPPVILLAITGPAATVRADANATGDWCEDQTQDPVLLAKVAELRSGPTASQPTPSVMNWELSVGDAGGEVDGAWDSLYKAGIKSYEIETCLNPLNNDPSVGRWTRQASSTKSKSFLTGFTPGARIWVRVRAIGPNGPGAWSDPATIIVP